MNTYIIDAIRTPIGNFGGTLGSVRTDDLAAIPIKELVKRTKEALEEKVEKEEILLPFIVIVIYWLKII